MSQTALQAAQAEAIAAKRAAREHAAQVAILRSELDKLNRQLEQTCTLRLQPHDASDSQVLYSNAGIANGEALLLPLICGRLGTSHKLYGLPCTVRLV